MKVIGEGEYNLDALKEIEIKEDFLSLDPSVQGCQNDDEMYNCTTRHYIDSLLRNCGCIPLNIRLTNKVTIQQCDKFEILLSISIVCTVVQYLKVSCYVCRTIT